MPLPLLDDRAWHNRDVEFSGQGLVFFEVGLCTQAGRDEGGVVGDPGCKVVFRKDGEGRTLSSGGADESAGAGEVGGRV